MSSRTGKSVSDERRAPSAHGPLRTWAGQGTGLKCHLCGRPIGSHEIEYEVELDPERPGKRLRFHFRCQQAWAEKTAAAR
jgi:hypothetical protein